MVAADGGGWVVFFFCQQHLNTYKNISLLSLLLVLWFRTVYEFGSEMVQRLEMSFEDQELSTDQHKRRILSATYVEYIIMTI
jgi:hypothetical protein